MTSTSNHIYFMENDDSREMSSVVPLSVGFFVTACVTGWYLFDLYFHSKKTDKQIQDLETIVDDMALRQEVHGVNMHDFEERIREKKDYDEEEEIEEGKWQAWEGEFEQSSLHFEPMIEMKITVWRQKLSTKKKNNEWVHGDDEHDASVTVRDFYLGNSNPEFKWEFVSRDCFGGDNYLLITTSDTFINGWDSTIKLHIDVKVHVPTVNDDESDEDKTERDILVDFLFPETDSCDDDNVLMNKILKKCIQEKLIHWARVLIDA